MFKINTNKSDKGRSMRLILLKLFALELGVHSINGVHITVGAGIGPLELSVNMHTWEKW